MLSEGTAAQEPALRDGPKVEATGSGQKDAVADDWEANLPIAAESLDGPLPTGSLFGALRKMRQTVNTYASQVCVVSWHNDFKYPVVQALERRLREKEGQIIGKYNLDVQVGYKQILSRITNLLLFSRALKSWADSQDEMNLVDVLKPFAEVERFTTAKSLTIAPDLRIVLMHARFYERLKGGSGVHEALKAAPFAGISECLALLQQPSHTATLADPEPAVADEAAAAAPEASTAEPVVSKKKKGAPPITRSRAASTSRASRRYTSPASSSTA